MWLCLASLAKADISFDERPFDVPDGVYQASFVEEVDGISVIRFSGDYNKSLSNGDVNAAARAVVAREFYQTHSDDYDFLVIFSDFEFDTGGARAFHLGVSNDVEGVGKPLFSNSALYGSESRLKGYIDMASIDSHETNSLEIDFRGGDDFSFTLRVLAHETLHQWGISTGIDALQGRDDGHWSFFMDTDASIEYGHSWRDNEDGTFTAEAARLRFSQLDLYLMGLAKKEDVPDFYVVDPIDGTEFSKGDLPRPGVTIAGTRQNFSIDDLIAVNGPRKPAFSESQKVFRYGFIYLTSSDESSRSATVDDDLGKIRQIRAEYEDRFSVLTSGRAIAQVYPPTRLTTSPGSALEIETEGVVDSQGEASIEKAITWLMAKQSDDGSFSDRESTSVRDSGRTLSTLEKSGAGLDAQERAIEWFMGIEPQNVDSLARKLTALEDKLSLQGDIVEALLTSQNSDGGWGLNDGLKSSVIDTALVMCSLSRSSPNSLNGALDSAFSFLVNAQNDDGGWSVASESASSVSITARVLSALVCSNRVVEESVQSAALNWLLARRNIDGGFGDPSSSVHESADVMLAFIAAQKPELLDLEQLTTFIVSQQSSLGDWSGSVYVTALVVEALQLSSITNLLIADIVVSDTEIYSGEIVELVALIENDTAQNANPTTVEFSYIDSSSSVVVFDNISIPEIPSMRSLEVTSYFDTDNIEGTLELIVNVDPSNSLVERSSLDNQKGASLEILSSPDGPELSISDQVFDISPKQVSTLPKLLTAQANIRNIGNLSAENVKLQLWQGVPNLPESEMLVERETSLAAQSNRVEVFEIDHDRIGETEYTILVDSNNQFVELNETDNQASSVVETIASVDLAVLKDSLSVNSDTIFLGQSVNIDATIINRGTTSSPSSKVTIIVRNTDGEQVLQEAEVSLEPGETRSLSAFWVADFEGSSTVELRVDSDNLVPEVDEQNNNASINIEAELAQGNNLSVNFSDLQFSPNPGLEGMGATLSALIRNSGTNDISAATISFYDGNPTTGGELIGSTTLVNLESENSRTVSVVWGAVPDNNDRFIYAVIDPNNELEEISEDDNIAFEKFNVISLPDFAVSGQSIMTSPTFPRINQETAFSIRVTNRGNQLEEALPINVYRGGVDNGTLIANGEIAIEGDSDALFEFTYTFNEFENAEISVVVDQEDLIRESSELNNTGSRRFTIQEGDFYLSDLYISPDDNGDKDSVEYFFNLAEEADVSVVITNIRGEVVRELEVADQAQAITSGSVEWDGKNEFGGLVADGRYQFSVLDQLGARQGERSVTLDTNRSPLAKAINTQFALERNLSCRFGQVLEFSRDLNSDERLLESVIYGPNDQFLYFPTFLEPTLDDQGELIATNENVLFPSGIYQAQNDGSQVVQLVADKAVADAEIGFDDPVAFQILNVAHIKISPNNKRMLVQTGFDRQFWVVDIETGELKRAMPNESVFGRFDDIEFINDEVAIFKSGIDSVFAIDTSSMTFTKLVELADTTDSRSDTRLVVNKAKTHALLPFSNTPYSSQVELFNLFDNSYTFSLALIDLQTRDISVVANNATGFSWSPNGDRFVVGAPNENSLNLFDTDGVEVQRIPFSIDQSLGYSSSQRDQLNSFFASLVGQPLLDEGRYAGDFGHFSWAPDGSEFAFVVYDYIATLIDSDGCPIQDDSNEGNNSEPNAPNFFNLVLSFFTGIAYAQEAVIDGMIRCYQTSPEILSLFDRYKTTDGIYIANLRTSSIEQVARTNTIEFNGFTAFNSVFPVLPIGDIESRFQDIEGVTVNEDGLALTEEGLVYVEVAGIEDFSVLYQRRFGAGRGVSELTARGIEWLEGARELLVSGGNQTFVLNIDSPEVSSRFIFMERSIFQRVKQTNTGKFLNWFSNDVADQCFNNGETIGYRQFQSLLNLTADLRARRVNDSGGFLLEGSAVDLNFESYILEFADVTQPDLWTAIAPASSKFVIDDRFTTWVAPYIGRFLIRLTVFDLAGNSRQEIVQVSNAEQASISALFTSEQFISPNGDGIQDATILNFRVLQSVNLDLRVFDSNDQQVRSIQRSFDLIGSEQAIEWNGRDSSGQVVPDGQYRLLIQNFEFFITVDNSAPVLVDSTEFLFLPPQNRPSPTPPLECRFSDGEPITIEDSELRRCSVTSNRRLSGLASDLTLQRISLQQRERSSLVWKESPNPLISADGRLINEEFSLDELRESEFRLFAIDFAGNTSILNIGDKKLGFAHIVGFPDSQRETFSPNSFGYANQPGFGVKPSFRSRQVLDPETDTRVLRYQHSATEEVQFVELLFKDSLSDEGYQSISVTPLAAETLLDSQEAFDITFDASSLPDSVKSFDVKIRLRLEGGGVMDTDTIRLFRDVTFLELNGLIPSKPILVPGVLAKVETNIRANQIERLVLAVTSTGSREDSRFSGVTDLVHEVQFTNGLGELETAVSTREINGAVILDQRKPAFMEEADPNRIPEIISSLNYENQDLGLIGECGFSYRLTVLLYTVGNLEPVTVSKGVDGACVEALMDIDPVFSPSCSGVPSGAVDIHYFARNVDGVKTSDAKPVLLRIGTPSLADSIDNNLFSVNLPELKEVYSFRLGTSPFPEGELKLRSILLLESGAAMVEDFTVPIVHQAPMVNVTYPVNETKLCAIQYRRSTGGGVFPGVEVQGRIKSSGPKVGMSLTLSDVEFGRNDDYFDRGSSHSFSAPSNGPEFVDAQQDNIRGPAADKIVRASSVKRVSDGKQIFFAPTQYIEEEFESNTQGVLSIPRVNFDGKVKFDIEVFDWSGASQCLAIESDVDGAIEGAFLKPISLVEANEPTHLYKERTPQYNYFSPNSDGSFDEALFEFQVDESVFVNVNVYETSFDSSTGEINRSDLIANPYNGFSVSAGETELAWNGMGDSGSTVDDGIYDIEFIIEDACGNQLIDSRYVGVDTQAPQAEIGFPIGVTELPIEIRVLGTVSDDRKGLYELSVSQDGSDRAVGAGRINSTGVLGEWNTFGLSGDWTLKLSAVDGVGNKSTTFETFTIPERQNLITSLATTEYFVSPNGDGRLDALTIRVAFERAVTASVSIKTLNGELLKQLSIDTSYNAGFHTLEWDGVNDGSGVAVDDVYKVEVIATGFGNVQTEFVQFELDKTPPAINLSQLNNDYLRLGDENSIFGSVSDRNFDSYELGIVAIDENQNRLLAPIELAQSTEQVDGVLAEIPEEIFELEQLYLSSALVKDLAGNQTRLTPFLAIDRTPPVLTLQEPTADAFFNSETAPVDIIGSVEDGFLENYSVVISPVSDLLDETQIALGGENIDPLEIQWDIDGLADGGYRVKLSAADQAGLKSSLVRSIVIDNTPPIAAFSQPQELAYITEPTSFIGSANDDYFSQYSISVALGHGEQTGSFNEILTSGLSRLNQRLFEWTELPEDGEYSIQLEAFDKVGNSESDVRQVIVDTIPPAVPKLIDVATAENREDILSNWEANSEPDLQGYILFRNGQAITSVISDVEYLDQALLEGEYTYQVLAVDNAGLRSELSEPLSALIDITPPLVQILQPKADSTVNLLVDIIGTAFSENDFKEYRIFVGQVGTPLREIERSSVPRRASELAQWDTSSITVEGDYLIRLEADDVNGNSAVTEVSVRIDNTPPEAPENLIAEISPSDNDDVVVTWDFPSNESDLLGFLLFRNGELANTNELVLGDLRQFAIDVREFTDRDRPDGTYEYIVYAIDKAGNISAPSNADDVELDNSAPIAKIVSVTDGQGFGDSLYLLAQTLDNDVAQVLLQFKPELDDVWLDIQLVQSGPFEYQWDTTSLEFGNYNLRAIATDFGGRVDEAAEVLTVTKQDVVAPAKVEGLVVSVLGSEGTLSWDASDADDLSAYKLYRAQCVECLPEQFELIDGSIIDITYQQIVDIDTAYQYYVTAVDGTGNESIQSDSILGVYGTADIRLLGPQRFVPIEGSVLAQGEAPSNSLLVSNVGFTLPIDEVVVNYSPAVGQASTQTISVQSPEQNPRIMIDLPTKGGIGLSAVAKSEPFNTVTRASESINVVAYGTPNAPTGLSAICAPSAFEDITDLTWDAADPSQDVVGYRLFRNSQRIRIGNPFADAPSVIQDATAFANIGASPQSFLPQSGGSQIWVPGDVDGVEFGQTWQGMREVSSLSLDWTSISRSARDIAIDVLLDGTYVEVAAISEGFSSRTNVILDRPIATTSIRVRVLRWNSVSSSSPGSLRQMSVFADELIIGTSFRDQVFGLIALSFGDASVGNEYQIQAVERFSGDSELSASFSIDCTNTVIEPPVGSGNFTIDGVADATIIVLNWQQISPDLYYEIYLEGEDFGFYRDDEVFAVGEARLERLSNGIYRLYIIARDETSQLVDVSNIVEVIVNQPLPMAPINLTANPDTANQAINLQWEIIGDTIVEDFYIYRSQSESSDFRFIGRVFGDVFEYTDASAERGVAYYYQVTLFDGDFNESEPSNIAEAELDSLVNFPVPVISSATDQYTAIIVSNSATQITGLAEQDASISLLKNGQFEGNAVQTNSIASSQNLVTELPLRFESGASNSNGDVAFIAQNFNTGDVQLWRKSGDSLDLISGTEIADWPTFSTVSFIGPDMVLVDQGGREDKIIYSLETKQFDIVDLGLPSFSTSLNSLIAFNQQSGTFVFNGFVSGQGSGDFLYDRKNLVATRLQGSEYSYSPDGESLAYLQSGFETGIAILDLESGLTETISLAPYSSPQFALNVAWSPDGSKLLLSPNGSVVIFPPSPDAVPLVVSRDTSSATAIAHSGLREAVWAGNNRVVFIDESADREFGTVVSLFDTVTQTSTELGRIHNDSFDSSSNQGARLVGFERTLKSGTIIQDSFVTSVIDFRPSGYFEFNDVELDSGENIFSVVAINESGETSDPAANVSISLQPDPLPDYQLDLELIPSIAVLNRASELRLIITNAGDIEAESANLSASVIDPEGISEQLVSQQIESLAPGASIEVLVSWVPLQSGDHILITAIDDEGLVEELSDANNRRIQNVEVRETVTPTIELDLERSALSSFVFAPNDLLQANLIVANPGPVFDGAVSVDVIDEFGAIVEQIELIQVENFILGEQRSFEIQWNSSPAVLGRYELRARLIDRENDLIEEQAQSFSLEESLTVLLGLRAQKFSFDANQDVRLTATMINRSDKAVLEHGRLSLKVFDQSDLVLSEQSIDSVNILVGGRLNETFVFLTLDNQAGEYRAEISLFDGDAELATASAKFEIVLQNRTFIGDLQVVRNELSIGESLAYQSDVSNMGNTSIDGLTITYRVEQGLEVVSSEPQLIEQLAVGQQLQEAREFSTTGLPNNRYKLVMLATQTLDSGERFTQRLDEESFSIVENLPPVISIDEPTNNSIVNSLRSSALATAIDESGVRSVEARFDKGTWFSINTSAFTANSYRIRLSDLAEGEHQISARATDTNGNSSSSIVHSFIVDNTPPNIEFSNIENDQLVTDSVLPVINVSDEHLDRVEMTLNGEPFNASQLIDEPGSYTLIVNAFDLAGNTQRASIDFSVVAAALKARDDDVELRRGALGNVKLLSNDDYRNTDDLTIEITELPSSGSLVKLNTGDYNYYPSLLFIGTDSFTYSLTDRVTKEVSSAKVTAIVRPGASCSFVPDHSVSDVGPVLLPAWARSSGDNQAPRFRIRITDISDIDAFETNAEPTITFPDCSLSYTPKIDTRKSVKVSYVVEDVASGGQRYTSPISTFEITIDTKADNPAIIVPVLQLLLLEEDK